MTKEEARREFVELRLPSIYTLEHTNGFHRRDLPMRRAAWNNFTDALCKARRITEKQYMTWTHIPECL
jgi:hypothetical protein